MKRLILYALALFVATVGISAPAGAAEIYPTNVKINYGSSAVREYPGYNEVWLSASAWTNSPRDITRDWTLQAKHPGGEWRSIRTWYYVERERRQLHVPSLKDSLIYLRVRISQREFKGDRYVLGFSDVAVIRPD